MTKYEMISSLWIPVLKREPPKDDARMKKKVLVYVPSEDAIYVEPMWAAEVDMQRIKLNMQPPPMKIFTHWMEIFPPNTNAKGAPIDQHLIGRTPF